jgi:Zinc carboxypeptidase
MLAAVLAAALVPVAATQPPAADLLDDRGLDAALAALEASPRVRVETLGWSHQGRPIRIVVVAEPGVLAALGSHEALAARLAGPHVSHPSLAEPRIEEVDVSALAAGAHLPVMFAGDSWGHEAATVEGLVKAARTLAFDDTEEVAEALSGSVALIVPLMNPDGRAAALEEWRRTPLSNGDAGIGNAYGFLINRDFVHATQPESRAVVEAILSRRPVVVVDHHEDAFHLGVDLNEVCFVEPFEPGFDVEEHPATRAAIVELGRAVAARWRQRGFRALFDPSGDRRFAPVPPPGEGLSPVAGSAGRLNLAASLHGIVSFITESARTPGSQSWEDRVEQRAAAVLAVLRAVSADPARYAGAVYARRLDEARRAGDRFVVVPEAGQPRDGLSALLDVLRLHRVSVFRTTAPYPALVVPLAQDEAGMARHLLAPVRSRLNELPPALGLEVRRSEELPEGERAAFRAAPLGPAWLVPAPRAREDAEAYAAEPTVRATALVNRLLAAGAATVSLEADRYRLRGNGRAIVWEAARLGVALEALPAVASESAAGARRRPPTVAVYAGQGVAREDWGEIAGALEAGEFPYRLVDDRELPRAGALDGVDALVVGQGSAQEIVAGWDPEAVTRRSPWEPAEPSHGIGPAGLDAIRRFVEAGGTYVGVGGGGALLAGTEYLGLTDAEMIASDVGLGQVRLRRVAPASPVLFGFPARITAFFNGPPGPPGRGAAFRAGEATVAVYDGARDVPGEQSFVSTELFAPGPEAAAAVVHERRGRGDVVLFGVSPAFRGEWRNTFRLLYDALYLAPDAR